MFDPERGKAYFFNDLVKVLPHVWEPLRQAVTEAQRLGLLDGPRAVRRGSAGRCYLAWDTSALNDAELCANCCRLTSCCAPHPCLPFFAAVAGPPDHRLHRGAGVSERRRRLHLQPGWPASGEPTCCPVSGQRATPACLVAAPTLSGGNCRLQGCALIRLQQHVCTWVSHHPSLPLRLQNVSQIVKAPRMHAVGYIMVDLVSSASQFLADLGIISAGGNLFGIINQVRGWLGLYRNAQQSMAGSTVESK